MIENTLAWLTGIIVGVISAGGYVGVALLIAIESACIPLPSEVIMPFAGYLVSVGQMSLVLVATAGALGCNLGSAVAYAIGRHGGRPAVERWGRYVLVSAEELRRVERLFERHGGLAVFLGRLLPVVRTFIALPAGIAGMSQVRFHLYTFAGSWPWCFALAWIGVKLGEKWNSDPRVRDVFHKVDALVVAALVLAAAWWLWSRWRHRIRRA
jgi:membrane protein DedA with SNARE-associated domain